MADASMHRKLSGYSCLLRTCEEAVFPSKATARTLAAADGNTAPQTNKDNVSLFHLKRESPSLLLLLEQVVAPMAQREFWVSSNQSDDFNLNAPHTLHQPLKYR